MATQITVKRSSVEGKIPLTTDLQLGELAINTYDGKLYLKRNDTLQDYIVEVGGRVGFDVKNQTGSTITKGTLVRFAGTLGSSGKLLIAPFIANNTVSSDYFMGVVAETIVNGGDGFVISQGKLLNYNTSAWADGTVLYASAATAGAFTSTLPSAPNNKITVAAVVHSHASAGVLQIRVTTGSRLGNDELVELASLQNNQTIVYNSTTNRFENTALKTVNGTSLIGSGNITISADSPLSIGSTPPADPVAKPFWWDNTSGILKLYYTDQDSSQWVDATPAGFSTSQGSGITTGKAIAMAIVFG